MEKWVLLISHPPALRGLRLFLDSSYINLGYLVRRQQPALNRRKLFADSKNICCYHDGEQGQGHLLPPAPDEAVVSYEPPLCVPQSVQLVLQCDGRAAAALLILEQIFVPKCYLSGFMPSNQVYIL